MSEGKKILQHVVPDYLQKQKEHEEAARVLLIKMYFA
jgi:hypothetical protein